LSLAEGRNTTGTGYDHHEKKIHFMKEHFFNPYLIICDGSTVQVSPPPTTRTTALF